MISKSRKMHYYLSKIIFLILWLPFGLSAGGINLYEISSDNIRLASAGWSARAEDPSTLFTNPAGMTRLQEREVQLGAGGIYGNVFFKSDDETDVLGANGYADSFLPTGSFFYVHPINENLTVGLGNLGYFGADLHYNSNWVGRYYLLNVMLEGFSLVPSVAYKISDCFSVGVGLNAMYGIFHQRSAISNRLDLLSDGKIKLKDQDFAFGAVIGVLYEASPCLRFGIQYLSRVDLRFKMKPKLENAGPTVEDIITDFDLSATRIKVKANVPQSVVVSAYYDVDSTWSIMGDIGWQEWSKFEKVSIAFSSTNGDLTFKPKYQDTWHAAVGVEYRYYPCWTFSSGIAYDTSAVTKAERTPDFPVGKQWRFGTGAKFQYSPNLAFDLSYELQWSGDLSMDVNKGSLAGRVAGNYDNFYIEFFCFNLTYVF